MSWFPKRNVIVPIDFSDDSFKAAEVALELVESPTHLTLVHILPEISAVEAGMIWEGVSDGQRIGEAEASLRKKFSDEKHRGLHVIALIGDAGHKIAEIAEKLQADLIIIPSHGRTGLTRLLIGSVAERVVRLAHCPVLVLRK